MAQRPRTTVALFDGKIALEEASKNWNNLPSILSMRLCEWIGALTHPKTGVFPNGVSPRQLCRLGHNQIAAASKELGSELKPMWRTSNHLGVMLWNEVKAGRIIRLHKACYVGNFHNKPGIPSVHRAKAAVRDVVETVRNDRLASSSSSSSNSKISTPTACETAKTNAEPFLEQTRKANIGNMGESSANPPDFQCFVCKLGLDATGSNSILKCIDCMYQTHVQCAYPNGTVPVNLLKRVPAAVSKWRCYDCKRCHLCGGKDDSNDGLLLCDGCDAGEHMGCQKTALNEVPPAPWFCSLCRVPTDIADALVSSATNSVSTTTSDACRDAEPSALVIDEQPDVESRDNKPSVVVIDNTPSPDCPSSQSDADSAQPQSTTSQPPTLPRAVKNASPPWSDEMPEVGQQRRSSDGSTTTSETKVTRTSLDKHEANGQRVVEGQKEPSPPPRRRRRYKRVGSPSNCDLSQKIARLNSSSSRENSAKYNFRSRECRRDKDDSDLLSFMSEDLPLLNEHDTKSVKGAKLWSVNDTAAFIERMGYAESAKAFKREEIDGAALLLLRRQDVLLNLGLKLGPALKTYKFVRYIQSAVRSA